MVAPADAKELELVLLDILDVLIEDVSAQLEAVQAVAALDQEGFLTGEKKVLSVLNDLKKVRDRWRSM